MPKLRLEKFGYKKCVECSDVSSYRAINTTNGKGDHIWNEIQIVTQDQYDQYQGQTDSQFDKIPETTDEDSNLYGPVTIVTPD